MSEASEEQIAALRTDIERAERLNQWSSGGSAVLVIMASGVAIACWSAEAAGWVLGTGLGMAALGTAWRERRLRPLRRRLKALPVLERRKVVRGLRPRVGDEQSFVTALREGILPEPNEVNPSLPPAGRGDEPAP